MNFLSGARRTRAWQTAAAMAAFVAATGGPGISEARPLEHFRYVDQANFVADFCGADVPFQLDYTATGTVTGRVTGGTIRYMDTVNGTEVLTNIATGRAITIEWHEVDQDLSITDNGDGTMNVVFQGAGEGKTYGPDGKFVDGSLGAGSLRHLVVIDYGGTWTDTSDDTFISETPLTNHGPGAEIDHCALYRSLTA